MAKQDFQSEGHAWSVDVVDRGNMPPAIHVERDGQPFFSVYPTEHIPGVQLCADEKVLNLHDVAADVTTKGGERGPTYCIAFAATTDPFEFRG